MFPAIIFDLDGTLIDSYLGILQSLNETLTALGHPAVDLQTVKRMVGRGMLNLLQQAAGDDWQKGLELFRASYDRTHVTGSSLLPEVKEALEMLTGQRRQMAIASNKPADYTRSILKHLNIDHFFQQVSGPDGIILPKPNPAMLTGIMQAFGIHPYETLYVGDMPLDVETARNAKTSVALIPSGGGTPEELRTANPDYLLRSLKELCSL